MLTSLTILCFFACLWALVLIYGVHRFLRSETKHGLPKLIFFGAIFAVLWSFSQKPGTIVSDRVLNFVAVINGSLVGDDGLIAETTQTAAVEAFEAETANILNGVASGISNAVNRIRAASENVATNDVKVYYVTMDDPRDFPGVVTNHNLAVTGERWKVNGTNSLSVWLRFSWEVEEAAEVTLRVHASSNTYWVLTSFTNSFPVAETFVNPGGWEVSCYRYDFDIRNICHGCPLMFIPPYEADFGGSEGEPFEVPGLGIVVIDGAEEENVGATGWFPAPPPFDTRLMIRHVGGAAVEALLDGTNVTGTITL